MHWRNSDFQIAHFLAGKCHTADGAYRMLMELREERQIALVSAQAGELRTLAKLVKARAWWRNLLPWMRLENQADLVEINGIRKQVQDCIHAAEHEIVEINTLLNIVQPHRKHAGLPDHAAHQAAQRDEWRLELIARAENMLLSTGSIPWDQLETMRAHPDWNAEIQPHISKMITNKDLTLVKGHSLFIEHNQGAAP